MEEAVPDAHARYHDRVDALVVNGRIGDPDVVEHDAVELEVRAADERALLIGHVADAAISEDDIVAAAGEARGLGERRVHVEADEADPAGVVVDRADLRPRVPPEDDRLRSLPAGSAWDRRPDAPRPSSACWARPGKPARTCGTAASGCSLRRPTRLATRTATGSRRGIRPRSLPRPLSGASQGEGGRERLGTCERHGRDDHFRVRRHGRRPKSRELSPLPAAGVRAGREGPGHYARFRRKINPASPDAAFPCDRRWRRAPWLSVTSGRRCTSLRRWISGTAKHADRPSRVGRQRSRWRTRTSAFGG